MAVRKSNMLNRMKSSVKRSATNKSVNAIYKSLGGTYPKKKK